MGLRSYFARAFRWQRGRHAAQLFRPDACEHSVTRVVGGSRYVFSLGWVLGRAKA